MYLTEYISLLIGNVTYTSCLFTKKKYAIWNYTQIHETEHAKQKHIRVKYDTYVKYKILEVYEMTKIYPSIFIFEGLVASKCCVLYGAVFSVPFFGNSLLVNLFSLQWCVCGQLSWQRFPNTY